MSSQALSSTQGSELTSSPPPPESSQPLSNVLSYRELSGEQIFQELQELQRQGIFYAADKNISSQCEFFYNKDLKGDMLIPKDSENELSEYVLTGIFQIDAHNFFMTSDGKWNSNNVIGTHFHQVKPTCHLLPVQRNPEFEFSYTDFPSIIGNLHAIESLANPRKTRDTTSIVIGESGQLSSIKLTHHLFVVRRFFFILIIF
jgi:hypothetical protein